MTNKDDAETKAQDAELAAACAALVPAELEKQPGILEKLKHANESDRGAHKFECKRWGDFLAVFISRGPDLAVEDDPNQTTRLEDFQVQKFVTAINLAKSSRVDLKPGRAADLGGSAYYVSYQIYDHEKKSYAYVKPHLAYYPFGAYGGSNVRPSVLEAPSQMPSMMAYGSSNSKFLRQLSHLARPSVDDQIVFCGTGVTLCVPFGLGREVFDKILAAGLEAEKVV